jgi:AbrB family looped-hinge helix DNA binding protein
MSYQARIVAGGKVSLPAELRRALALKEGDTLVFEQDGDGMRVRSFDAVISDVQHWARQFQPASGALASDELVAERRTEAARDTLATVETRESTLQRQS